MSEKSEIRKLQKKVRDITGQMRIIHNYINRKRLPFSVANETSQGILECAFARDDGIVYYSALQKCAIKATRDHHGDIHISIHETTTPKMKYKEIVIEAEDACALGEELRKVFNF